MDCLVQSVWTLTMNFKTTGHAFNHSRPPRLYGTGLNDMGPCPDRQKGEDRPERIAKSGQCIWFSHTIPAYHICIGLLVHPDQLLPATSRICACASGWKTSPPVGSSWKWELPWALSHPLSGIIWSKKERRDLVVIQIASMEQEKLRVKAVTQRQQECRTRGRGWRKEQSAGRISGRLHKLTSVFPSVQPMTPYPEPNPDTATYHHHQISGLLCNDPGILYRRTKSTFLAITQWIRDTQQILHKYFLNLRKKSTTDKAS